MKAEIIAVGTEILLGDITNTHARYLAKELSYLGIDLLHQSVVGDNHGRLAAAVSEALERSDLVLLTGGLGPTNDDLTKETVCEVMGIPMELNPEALSQIEAYFAKTGREMPENNRKQAMLPVGGTVFYNAHGTAPGAAVEKDGKCVIMMPGPPRELIPMFENGVRPFLQRFSKSVMLSHTLVATGIGESSVAAKLSDVLERSNPTVALYAKDGEVQIRVTAKTDNKQAAEEMMAPVIGEINRRLGDFVYGMDVPNLQSVVVSLLKEQAMMIATAESCTGGLLSQKLTEIPGASAVFEFGVSSYSNRIKEEVLEVPKEVLKRCGAVSSEVAVLMAAGAQKKGNADIGVGITGIAGPGGGTEEKPVGRVFVAVSYRSKYWVEKLTIGHGAENERDYIRNIAVLHALNMVRLLLEGSPRAVSALLSMPGTDKIAEDRAAAKPSQAVPAAGAATFAAASLVDTPPIEMDDFSEEEGGLLLDSDGTALLAYRPETQEIKKPSLFMRFLRYIFPWKGDSVQEIIRKVIFLVAIITLVGSSIYIIDYFNAHLQADKVFNETLQIYDREPTEAELANLPDGYLEKFAALYDKNPEIKGWVSIPNSRVNHPVMQTQNNDYYMDHDFKHNSNRYGTPFIDYRCTLENGKASTNTIIYGHNGASGKVFCDVKNYSNVNFYRGSPTITFDSVYEESQWKVLAVFIANGKDDGDGYFFDYHNFIEAENEAHFNWFIRQVRRRSLINIPVDVEYGDSLLTLSTCCKSSDLEDGRLVVVARKVREGESPSVSTGQATVNSNPQYPNAWYRQHNKEIPNWPNDPNPAKNNNNIPIPGDDFTSSDSSRPSSFYYPPVNSKRPPASSFPPNGSSSDASSGLTSSKPGSSNPDESSTPSKPDNPDPDESSTPSKPDDPDPGESSTPSKPDNPDSGESSTPSEPDNPDPGTDPDNPENPDPGTDPEQEQQVQE